MTTNNFLKSPAFKISRIGISLLFLSVTESFPANVVVGSIQELTNAVSGATRGDTIFVKDGTYRVISYGISVRTANLAIIGQSGNRDKVIITGAGMNGNIQYGFWISANQVTIKNMTIQNVRNHLIQTDVNTDGLHVSNCVFRDAHEQFLKIPYNANLKDFSENGIVENCLFYFTKGVGNQYYTGGVDGHYCKNWIIRNNIFKNIRSPDGTIAEHAVHFWSNSEGTLVENNQIINCDRGIGFGLGDRGHIGGIIRNNMIYHAVISGVDNGDGGIILESSPGTRVYNNTIYFENAYPNAIEYRFTATAGVLIQNNLTNRKIRLRDGASGTVSNNIDNALGSWFITPAEGDLHLASSSTPAANQGVAIDGLTADFDGQPRTVGAIDIGADEYGSASTLRWKNAKIPRHDNSRGPRIFAYRTNQNSSPRYFFPNGRYSK